MVSLLPHSSKRADVSQRIVVDLSACVGITGVCIRCRCRSTQWQKLHRDKNQKAKVITAATNSHRDPAASNSKPAAHVAA